MTQGISPSGGSGFATELAELMVRNETAQSESAHQEREAARASIRENAQKQIDALHDAADATRSGAFLNAALTIGGSALEIKGAFNQYGADMASAQMKAAEQSGNAATVLSAGAEYAGQSRLATIWRTSGDSMVKLAAPLQSMIGDSVATDYQAEAKRRETLAEQARWQADDASAAIDKADKRGDKAIELLQGIQQENNSSTQSIIGRI
jgi:hypothetical protein